MAVRRVSDLPNLDIVYPGAELSDCLFEVSYSTPDNPRRYQSFYANALSTISKMPYVSPDELHDLCIVIRENFGNYLPLSSTVTTSSNMVAYPGKWPNSRAIIDYINFRDFLPMSNTVTTSSNMVNYPNTWPNSRAIMDYISSLGFLTPEALGPTLSPKDLANQLKALLNTKDLYIFISQNGVRVSDVITNEKLWFDVVDTAIYSDYGELRGSGVTFVWKEDPPTEYSTKYYTMHKNDVIFFKTLSDAKTMAQRFKFLQGAGIRVYICTDLITPLRVSYTINEDNVQINSVSPITMTLDHSDRCLMKIVGIKIIQISRSINTDGEIKSYGITLNYATRVIFTDIDSIYNVRWGYNIDTSMATVFQRLLFDAGTSDQYKWNDRITYNNYCIHSSPACDELHVNYVGFLFHYCPLMGYNIYVKSCSFVKDQICVSQAGGFGYNEEALEALSCDIVFQLTGGTIERGWSTRLGGFFIDQKSEGSLVACNRYSYIQLGLANTYIPFKDVQFISVDSTGAFKSYVSWTDVKNKVWSNESLANIAVNPVYNQIIPCISGNVISCEKSDFIDNRDVENDEGYLQYLSKIIDVSQYSTSSYQWSDGGLEYTNPKMYISMNAFQQIATYQSFNKIYSNYVTDRINPTSNLRQLYTTTGANQLYFLWDLPYYQANYNVEGHQLTAQLSNEAFHVVENSRTVYDLLSDNFEISPTSYSLSSWRQIGSYSWKNLTYSELSGFIYGNNGAIVKYGYS